MATGEQNYKQESQDAQRTPHCSSMGYFNIGMDVRQKRVKSFSKRGDNIRMS